MEREYIKEFIRSLLEDSGFIRLYNNLEFNNVPWYTEYGHVAPTLIGIGYNNISNDIDILTVNLPELLGIIERHQNRFIEDNI